MESILPKHEESWKALKYTFIILSVITILGSIIYFVYNPDAFVSFAKSTAIFLLKLPIILFTLTCKIRAKLGRLIYGTKDGFSLPIAKEVEKHLQTQLKGKVPRYIWKQKILA